uniref:EF-hand domain-containing protein n=1 Tax=Erythrolobus madagascarensis TaxID=708628 RepID=A0A7S0XJP7_9RHOD|mmetsp:Transcript_3400/g.7341  ORF Transcript_3400/g.7341 Transcript_3400/m.7341 type:complete len:183 (+) Transcript_3400:72-620(+)
MVFNRKNGHFFREPAAEVAEGAAMEVASFRMGEARSAVDALTEEQREEIDEAFYIFDPSEQGLDAKGLRSAMRSLGFDPSKDDVRILMANSTTIDEEQFRELMAYQMELKQMRNELSIAFGMFDKQRRGRIGFADLKKVVVELGENLTDEELRSMISAADKNGDGEVSLDEYMDIMKVSGLW